MKKRTTLLLAALSLFGSSLNLSAQNKDVKFKILAGANKSSTEIVGSAFGFSASVTANSNANIFFGAGIETGLAALKDTSIESGLHLTVHNGSLFSNSILELSVPVLLKRELIKNAPLKGVAGLSLGYGFPKLSGSLKELNDALAKSNNKDYKDLVKKLKENSSQINLGLVLGLEYKFTEKLSVFAHYHYGLSNLLGIKQNIEEDIRIPMERKEVGHERKYKDDDSIHISETVGLSSKLNSVKLGLSYTF